jgi:hypothetical protein
LLLEDIERFVTDPIEEGVKGISNIVEIASTSQDDYAIVAIEFDEEIEVDLAKQKVKDEVDAVVASGYCAITYWSIFPTTPRPCKNSIVYLNLEETLVSYAKRMCEKVTHPNPVLIGVSFGGILVQEMSKIISCRGTAHGGSHAYN